jgi:predicted Zn-dependent protease
LPSRVPPKPRPRRVAALLCCGLLALSCAVNPVSGRPEVVLMSTAREAQLGAEAAGEVARSMGLVRDEAIVSYVSQLGQRVARHSPRQDVTYRFFVVDMEEPNAFALPGGYVYVTRGLLALANDEAELAHVIGHEIGHVAARHAAQRQTRAAGVGLVLLPAAIGGAVLGSLIGAPGDLLSATVNVPLQLLGVGLIAAYSREQEHEADEVGQAMAAAAGFDPKGLPRLLTTLEAQVHLQTGKERRPGFLDTHPSTPSRIADTMKRAESIEAAPGETLERADFLARLDGLLVGANPAEGIFEDQRYLHPDLDFTVAFPGGWQTLNERAGVGAFAPERDAQIILEIQSEGGDPATAAREALEALARDQRVRVTRETALEIGPHPAYRVDLVAGSGRDAVAIDATWVAKGGLIYRFSGMAQQGAFEKRQPALRSVSGSFRRLQPTERASIRERRLRIAVALAGESLGELGARSGNAWSVEETAVVNGLAPSELLSAGQRVKVAARERYAGPASR